MPATAADIMTSPVVTVLPQASLAQIAELLNAKHISAVPVCDADGRLAGIVSEEDVLRPFRASVGQRRDWWLTLLAEGERLGQEFLDYIRADGRSAAEVMVRDVRTAGEQTALPELAEMMIQHGVKRIPIVKDGRVVGIVARSDLVRAIADAPAMLV